MPRSLWDPTYDEGTWVSDKYQDPVTGDKPIRLIPRIKALIEDIDPEVELAITEYNYGGGNHASGAVAQADLLGIFGREDVYAATLWDGDGQDHTMMYGAFKMYLNYHGAGARFGETSVSATSSSNRVAAVNASERSDGRVIIVAINRSSESKKAKIFVRHGQDLPNGKLYRLGDDGSPHFIANTGTISGSRLGLPPMSVSIIDLRP